MEVYAPSLDRSVFSRACDSGKAAGFKLVSPRHDRGVEPLDCAETACPSARSTATSSAFSDAEMACVDREARGTANDLTPVYVKNTFIETFVGRPLSLESFFQERDVCSCPCSPGVEHGEQILPTERDDARQICSGVKQDVPIVRTGAGHPRLDNPQSGHPRLDNPQSKQEQGQARVSECAPDVVVKNTFIEHAVGRPPSLEGFYQEREIRSFPGSRCVSLEDFAAFHFFSECVGEPAIDDTEACDDRKAGTTPGDSTPVYVKNTFIESFVGRPQSLESFFQERGVCSCPCTPGANDSGHVIPAGSSDVQRICFGERCDESVVRPDFYHECEVQSFPGSRCLSLDDFSGSPYSAEFTGERATDDAREINVHLQRLLAADGMRDRDGMEQQFSGFLPFASGTTGTQTFQPLCDDIWFSPWANSEVDDACGKLKCEQFSNFSDATASAMSAASALADEWQAASHRVVAEARQLPGNDFPPPSAERGWTNLMPTLAEQRALQSSRYPLHVDDALAASTPPCSVGSQSIGSVGHGRGDCKPCAFYHTKGCSLAESCDFCHVCPAGEKKRRTLERKEMSRRRKEMRSTKA